MWFIFGLITITGFCLYAGYRRINASWKGNEASVSGLRYQSKELRNKHKTTGFLIGIESRKEIDYSFKEESGIDRFFKSVGVSSEYQVGKKEFDDLVYIVSDCEELHKFVSSNKQITDSVIKLFGVADKFQHSIKEIRHNSGKLWIRFKSGVEVKDGDVYIISKEVVPILAEIDKAIEAREFPLKLKWKDPFVIKAAIILAVSTGLAFNGLAHVLRFIWVEIPFTLDALPLFKESFIYGSGVIVVLVLLTFVLLGRGARTHLVLIEILLVGYFGAVSSSYAELRDINMELDTSSPVLFDVETYKKRISRKRRSTSYYIYVNDWTNDSSRKSVEVSSNFYHSVSIGDKLVVTQKSGYLGYKWVEEIKKHSNGS